MEKQDSTTQFLMGAGVMLAGFLAGSVVKSFTIDNARKVILFADEIKERGQDKPPTVFPPSFESEEPQMPTNPYSDYYDRTPPPPPPPSEDYQPRYAVPVAISRDEDDFYSRINEEAMAGRNLIDDWVNV